jgi:hypothetical protein
VLAGVLDDDAAVDPQVAAGDEGTVWTHQIGSGRTNFVVCASPTPAEVLVILSQLRSGRRVQCGSTRHVELVASGCDGGDDAAVDQEVGAGNEGAVAAHQECGGGPDLVWRADPSGGGCLDHPLVRVAGGGV